MRALVLLGLLAGCFGGSADSLNPKNDDGSGSGGGVGPPNAKCAVQSDCVPAATTCCECPTFATNAKDPIVQACSGVQCPPNDSCPASVEADCVDNQCVLKCAAIACTGVCPVGYATDASGCLTCECAAAIGGCVKDADCVETRADCCGCQRGGNDTAVLGSDQARFDAALGCESMPACPEVNTCIAGDAPRCVQGQCELLSEGPPANACGRADLPNCPAGTVCTVNASDPGNLYGVGTCVGQ